MSSIPALKTVVWQVQSHVQEHPNNWLIQKVIMKWHNTEDKSSVKDMQLVLIRKIQIVKFSTFHYLKAILTYCSSRWQKWRVVTDMIFSEDLWNATTQWSGIIHKFYNWLIPTNITGGGNNYLLFHIKYY